MKTAAALIVRNTPEDQKMVKVVCLKLAKVTRYSASMVSVRLVQQTRNLTKKEENANELHALQEQYLQILRNANHAKRTQDRVTIKEAVFLMLAVS